MKFSDFCKMIGRKLVDSVAGVQEPVQRSNRLSRDWHLPDEPKWAGYMTGRVNVETGLPVPGVRPIWRAKFVGDRSKYKPNEIDQKKNRAARKAGLL